MSRIERWTRHFLESEARKRGVSEPEAQSPPSLLRAIVQHDYTAGHGLRDQARKILHTLVAGAVAAPALLKHAAARPLLAARNVTSQATQRLRPVEWATQQLRPVHSDTQQLRPVDSATQQLRPVDAATQPLQPVDSAAAQPQPRAAAAEAQPLRPGAQPEQPLRHVDANERVSGVEPTAAVTAAHSQLLIERKNAEIQLSWQVTLAATAQARALLGQPGELALRVVSVRRDPKQVVCSETSEHGPVATSGAWTVLLPSADAHCVGAVGLRHGEHFVSIVHQSSRAAS